MNEELPAVRIDVWLWAARFFKTRSLAKQAIEAGKISMGDIACKAAKLVRSGERIKVLRGEERMIVEVLALSEKRGPASAAQALYRETDESRRAREAKREQDRLLGTARPDSRPDKRARRLIHRFLRN
jgi:ribosome-associated heat shock protein Hsp15